MLNYNYPIFDEYELDDIDMLDPSDLQEIFPDLPLRPPTTSCNVRDLHIRKVVEHESASDSLVAFGQIDNKPAVFKIAYYQPSLHEIKTDGTNVQPLEYERAIYQRFVNGIRRQHVSPNFVGYITTFICPYSAFIQNLNAEKRRKGPLVKMSDQLDDLLKNWKRDQRIVKMMNRSSQYQVPELSDKPPYVVFLAIESLHKPIAIRDLIESDTLQRTKSELKAIVFQTLFTLSVMEHYKFHHFDMHTKNVMIEQDTSDLGSLHTKPIIYAIGPDVKKDLYCFSVQDNLVKFFDWDWGFNEDIGPNLNKLCCRPYWDEKNKMWIHTDKRCENMTEDPDKPFIGSRCNEYNPGWDTNHHLMSLLQDGLVTMNTTTNGKHITNILLNLLKKQLKLAPQEIAEIATEWAWGPQTERYFKDVYETQKVPGYIWGHYEKQKLSSDKWKWANWMYKDHFNPINILKNATIFNELKRDVKKVPRRNVFFHPSLSQTQRDRILNYVDNLSGSSSSSSNKSRRISTPAPIPKRKLGTQSNPYPTAKAALQAGHKRGDLVWHRVRGQLRNRIK